MSQEKLLLRRDHTTRRLVHVLRKQCGRFALAAASALATACTGTPAEPAPAAGQQLTATSCARQPEDCPWAMNSGKNASCIEAEPGRSRRWRCWKVVAREPGSMVGVRSFVESN
jgi:hypothetical protein